MHIETEMARLTTQYRVIPFFQIQYPRTQININRPLCCCSTRQHYNVTLRTVQMKWTNLGQQQNKYTSCKLFKQPDLHYSFLSTSSELYTKCTTAILCHKCKSQHGAYTFFSRKYFQEENNLCAHVIQIAVITLELFWEHLTEIRIHTTNMH